MYDPFRRARRKAVKKLGRATTSALARLVSDVPAPKAKRPKATRKTPKSAVVKPASTARSPSKAGGVMARNGRAGSGGAAKAPVPATSRSRTTIPPGASFTTGVHVGESGKRSFRVYIPATVKTAATPPPLLVMLHGCRQTPEDFARGTGMNVLAEEHGFVVVYPAQEGGMRSNRCWNWFRTEDQNRGEGEPALIAGLTRRVVDEADADPSRVYVAGLSAGASTALIVAAAYPDIFAAVGAHSGLPVGAARDKSSALAAMRFGSPGGRRSDPMPTISFHGDADRVVNPRNGRFVTSRALEQYRDLRETRKAGRAGSGREYVRISHRIGKGRSFVESWVVAGTAHAWSGGNPAGSFTDPSGPDASREMIRFFMRHRTTLK